MRGSFYSAIRDAVENVLHKGGHECKTIDLDKAGFDPVMREKDLAAFVAAGRMGEDGLDGVYFCFKNMAVLKERPKALSHQIFTKIFEVSELYNMDEDTRDKVIRKMTT